MAGRVDARLKELGIELPPPGPPAGNYVPHVKTGNLVFISGQIPLENGERKFVGKVGEDFSVEEGQQAARLCMLSVIARLAVALDGDLDRVTRCVKIGGFVNASPDFGEQPAVINGASDLTAEVFGDIGAHARFAVGVGSLPFGVAVEVDAIFEVA